MASTLNKKVLLLNQSYQPLMTLGAKRAIILSFTEKVEVLERYSDEVRSINLSIFIPSVIRLKDYVKLNQKRIPLSRKNILCYSQKSLEIFILPVSVCILDPAVHGRGRRRLRCACWWCTSIKGGYYVSMNASCADDKNAD